MTTAGRESRKRVASFSPTTLRTHWWNSYKVGGRWGEVCVWGRERSGAWVGRELAYRTAREGSLTWRVAAPALRHNTLKRGQGAGCTLVAWWVARLCMAGPRPAAGAHLERQAAVRVEVVPHVQVAHLLVGGRLEVDRQRLQWGSGHAHIVGVSWIPRYRRKVLGVSRKLE